MVEFIVESEDSSDGWRFLKPQDKTVLDLGCGRWCTREGSWDHLDPNEFTSIYLANNGAQKLIGIDSSVNEINILNDIINKRPIVSADTNKVDNEYSVDLKLGIDKFLFIHESIGSPTQLKSLIRDHGIDLIKCDIEGAEVNFYELTKDDMSTVNQMALEYHQHGMKERFLEKFQEWGLTPTHHGKMWIDGLGLLYGERI